MAIAAGATVPRAWRRLKVDGRNCHYDRVSYVEIVLTKEKRNQRSWVNTRLTPKLSRPFKFPKILTRERVIGSYPHSSYATLPTPIHTYISTHHGTMTYISINFYPHSPLPAQVPLKPHLHLQTHIHNNTLPYSDPFPGVHIHAPTPTESIPIASFVRKPKLHHALNSFHMRLSPSEKPQIVDRLLFFE
ncbi:hypothetical protein LXL04_005236 [Taraxacum kok-saghyz]